MSSKTHQYSYWPSRFGKSTQSKPASKSWFRRKKSPTQATTQTEYLPLQPTTERPVYSNERYVRHEPPKVFESKLHREVLDLEPVIERERIVPEYQPVVVRRKEVQSTSPREVKEEKEAEEFRQFTEVGKVDVDSEMQKQFQPYLQRPSTSTESWETEQKVRSPVVREKIVRKIYQDVQPVIDREVIEPHIVHRVKPVHEKVYDLPIIHKAYAVEQVGAHGEARPSGLFETMPSGPSYLSEGRVFPEPTYENYERNYSSGGWQLPSSSQQKGWKSWTKPEESMGYYERQNLQKMQLGGGFSGGY